jgi:uncharacterized protein
MQDIAHAATSLAPLLATIRRRGEAIRRLGVTSLSIYGSRARGDNRPDSDLDVMVECRPGTLSILELLSIKHMIEDDTGLEVHISTRESFPTDNQRRFERDLVRVL